MNYGTRASDNAVLEVKYDAVEILDGKYAGRVWQEDELVPQGGRRVRP